MFYHSGFFRPQQKKEQVWLVLKKKKRNKIPGFVFVMYCKEEVAVLKITQIAGVCHLDQTNSSVLFFILFFFFLISLPKVTCLLLHLPTVKNVHIFEANKCFLMFPAFIVSICFVQSEYCL